MVYILALLALFVIRHNAQGSSLPPPGLFVPYAVMAVTGVVMLLMWIGALVKLGQLRAWGWFVGVLVLHLVGLGIVGMVAYAVSGPEDSSYVAIRPSTPV
jgi:amino acid transporter